MSAKFYKMPNHSTNPRLICLTCSFWYKFCPMDSQGEGRWLVIRKERREKWREREGREEWNLLLTKTLKGKLASSGPNFRNDPGLFASANSPCVFHAWKMDLCLPWFASLSFPSVVPHSFCPLRQTRGQYLNMLFRLWKRIFLLLNLIFSASFLLRLCAGLNYFSFCFFPPAAVFVDTLSHWFPRCDALYMSRLVDGSGKSSKEKVISERSQMPRHTPGDNADGPQRKVGEGFRQDRLFSFIQEPGWKTILLFVTAMGNLVRIPLHEEICYSNQNPIPFYKPL